MSAAAGAAKSFNKSGDRSRCGRATGSTPSTSRIDTLTAFPRQDCRVQREQHPRHAAGDTGMQHWTPRHPNRAETHPQPNQPFTVAGCQPMPVPASQHRIDRLNLPHRRQPTGAPLAEYGGIEYEGSPPVKAAAPGVIFIPAAWLSNGTPNKSYAPYCAFAQYLSAR
jgi:hypothetical protein